MGRISGEGGRLCAQLTKRLTVYGFGRVIDISIKVCPAFDQLVSTNRCQRSIFLFNFVLFNINSIFLKLYYALSSVFKGIY